MGDVFRPPQQIKKYLPFQSPEIRQRHVHDLNYTFGPQRASQMDNTVKRESTGSAITIIKNTNMNSFAKKKRRMLKNIVFLRPSLRRWVWGPLVVIFRSFLIYF